MHPNDNVYIAQKIKMMSKRGDDFSLPYHDVFANNKLEKAVDDNLKLQLLTLEWTNVQTYSDPFR